MAGSTSLYAMRGREVLRRISSQDKILISTSTYIRAIWFRVGDGPGVGVCAQKDGVLDQVAIAVGASSDVYGAYVHMDNLCTSVEEV